MQTFTVQMVIVPDDVRLPLVLSVGSAAAAALTVLDGDVELGEKRGRTVPATWTLQALNAGEARRTAEVIRGAMQPLVEHVYEPVVRDKASEELAARVLATLDEPRTLDYIAEVVDVPLGPVAVMLTRLANVGKVEQRAGFWSRP